MEPRPERTERKTQIILWIEPALVDEADAVARDRFNGNRSELIRQAIRDLVDWEAAPQSEPEPVTA